jgi:DNA-binding response OmpR family regulator
MLNGLGRPASSDIEDAAPDAGDGRHYLDVRTPLCFVTDADEAQRHFISLALQSHGIETTLVAKPHGLRDALARRTPDFVFLDVPRTLADVADPLRALTECAYRGPVQLMSAEVVAPPEVVAALGKQHGLRLLPPLPKPVDRSAVRKVVREHRLDGEPSTAGRTSLDEALRKDWIEFWYQPKIDLRKKQLAGVELFARVRHPHHGPMLPRTFMDDGSEESLVELTERSLIHALTSGASFAKLGITFRLAVNVEGEVGFAADRIVRHLAQLHRILGTHRNDGDLAAEIVVMQPRGRLRPHGEDQVELVGLGELQRLLALRVVHLEVDDGEFRGELFPLEHMQDLGDGDVVGR